jgi:hypothetical protein
MKINPRLLFCWAVLIILITACNPISPSESQRITPNLESEFKQLGLTPEEIDTLLSIEKIDDHPLYKMHFYADYQRAQNVRDFDAANLQFVQNTWACSLFTTLADPGNLLYGRNFDWEFSPAILLFTDPPDGYASVSMVDFAYLGYSDDQARNLLKLSPKQLENLLYAPALPFDGMNEMGLAIGMAAVPPGNMKPDPNKRTIRSLDIIREILDRAETVGEAISIIEEFNINFSEATPLHYLVADRFGSAVLIEYYQGEIHILENIEPWHQATNFLESSVASVEGHCERYDKINQELSKSFGSLLPKDAISLLADVSQPSTQWSVVYEMSTGKIHIAMGRDYKNIHALQLDLVEE